MYGAWCPKEGRTSWQPYSDNKGVMQFKKVGTSSVKEMDRQRQLEFWNLVKQTDAEFPPEEDDEDDDSPVTDYPETGSSGFRVLKVGLSLIIGLVNLI